MITIAQKAGECRGSKMTHIGVRDHFRWGGGGGRFFFCKKKFFPRMSNMFGQCIFVGHNYTGRGGVL